MSKRIAMCCDGTGQSFQENKSNPLRLHYCLYNYQNDTGQPEQISFYDPGVGTFDPEGEDETEGFLGGIVSNISEKLVGGGLGYGIERNITDAYRFLMQTYENGDRIFLFGFSRGAFTANAVAGLVAKCGILSAHNENLIPYAMDIYLQRDNGDIATDFRETMSREAKIYFLGLWDSVKSLGLRHRDNFFYDKDIVTICEYGRHAVSIHEKRRNFQPELWFPEGQGTDTHKEVWFPGVHGDVGGGYPEDGPANCALRWMIAEAESKGLAFRSNRVEEFRLFRGLCGWVGFRLLDDRPRCCAVG